MTVKVDLDRMVPLTEARSRLSEIVDKTAGDQFWVLTRRATTIGPSLGRSTPTCPPPRGGSRQPDDQPLADPKGFHDRPRQHNDLLAA
jgi:hypothetical protein